MYIEHNAKVYFAKVWDDNKVQVMIIKILSFVHI